MIRLAIYGKGGIGKSTTASNLSLAFAQMGLRVLQVGCDPKADSTLLLRQGQPCPSILEMLKEKGPLHIKLSDMVIQGEGGVYLCEAGGPPPGQGCAGRGIVKALQELEKQKAYETYQIDMVIYDVLGDVVCGGFSMPIRDGYAENVFIITSGERMALHAAKNIYLAVDHFKERGYAQLSGVILNKRNVDHEEEKIQKFCNEIDAPFAGALSFSHEVQRADDELKTATEKYPDGDMRKEYQKLAASVLRLSVPAKKEMTW